MPVYQDFCLVGGVTVLSYFHQANVTRKLWMARQKYNIYPPLTDGPEEFIRVYRAHQNCVEWYPMYLASMWTSAMFFHQVPASVVGLVYIYAREKYFDGYSKEVKGRIEPWFLAMRCLKAFFLMSTLGVANSMSAKYLEYDVLKDVAAQFLRVIHWE